MTDHVDQMLDCASFHTRGSRAFTREGIGLSGLLASFLARAIDLFTRHRQVGYVQAIRCGLRLPACYACFFDYWTGESVPSSTACRVLHYRGK